MIKILKKIQMFPVREHSSVILKGSLSSYIPAYKNRYLLCQDADVLRFKLCDTTGT